MLPVPLELAGCMVHFKHRLPTSDECESLKRYSLTQGDIPWNPSAFSDQVADKLYQQVLHNELVSTSLNSKSDLSPAIVKLSSKNVIPYLSFFDPSDVFNSSLNGKPASPVFHVDSVQKADIEDLAPSCSEPHYSKAVPGKIDYENLSPYFAFRPHEVIGYTMQQTSQLAKSTIHFPMRRHLKSRFQMLRHKRLNEVIDTDTYFANEKSIEGFHCAQVFFGMTSRMLYVAGMKTESVRRSLHKRNIS